MTLTRCAAPSNPGTAPSLGASWDANCWYIGEGVASGKFARWSGDTPYPREAHAEGYAIVSHEACVVAATVACQHCSANIEVICIHGSGGTVMEEPLEQFTVAHIRDMDDALAGQLALWPHFRQAPDGGFANYCTRCRERSA